MSVYWILVTVTEWYRTKSSMQLWLYFLSLLCSPSEVNNSLFIHQISLLCLEQTPGSEAGINWSINDRWILPISISIIFQGTFNMPWSLMTWGAIALLPLRRKACYELVSLLKSIALGRVWTREHWASTITITTPRTTCIYVEVCACVCNLCTQVFMQHRLCVYVQLVYRTLQYSRDTTCAFGRWPAKISALRPANLPGDFHVVLSAHPCQCRYGTFNYPSISSPIHYSLIIMPFNATQSQLLTTSLKSNKLSYPYVL
jgi:hypothetical protein